MRNTRVVLSALGGPEVLKIIEDDASVPGAKEVLVLVLACGVAFADVLMRRGLYSGGRAAGVNAAFDAIGGRNWLRSYRALGKGGRFVGYGMSSAIEGGRKNILLAVGSFAWLQLVGLVPGKSARWYNIMTEKKKQPDQFREDLSRLLAMLQEKAICPVVAERLPLGEAVRAHELLERASVSGKIVLMCQE
jgi:NADPH:quinone reductase-like Zn-dependent oxidoreductase